MSPRESSPRHCYQISRKSLIRWEVTRFIRVPLIQVKATFGRRREQLRQLTLASGCFVRWVRPPFF